jgi:membrane protein
VLEISFERIRKKDNQVGRLTLKGLVRRTGRAVHKHHCFGRAAELAYYFLLAFFPMLIFVLSLISFMPGAQGVILSGLAKLMPRDAMNVVENWVLIFFSNRSGGLLSFGFVFSLWAASNGMGALVSALNAAYDVEEGRPFWKTYLVAIGLTIILTLLVIGGVTLLTFGEEPANWIANLVGLGTRFSVIWLSVRYLMGLAMLSIGVGAIYYVAPNVEQRLKWIAPGTVFAVVAFVIVSFLFSFYLRFAPNYNITYGSLGAVIIFMLWLYLMGLIMFIGGEINSEIVDATGKRVIQKEYEHQKAA